MGIYLKFYMVSLGIPLNMTSLGGGGWWLGVIEITLLFEGLLILAPFTEMYVFCCLWSFNIASLDEIWYTASLVWLIFFSDGLLVIKNHWRLL